MAPPNDDGGDNAATNAAAKRTPGSNVLEEEETAAASVSSKESKKTPAKSKKKTPKSSKKKTKQDTSSHKTPAVSSNSTTAPSPNKKKPTMTEMVHDAIVSMGDRTGSSGIAIGRFLLQKYDYLEDTKSFRSRLNLSLKSAVKNTRFKKVRNSYKIDAAYAKKEREKKRKQSKKMSEQEKKRLEEEARQVQEKKQKELEATLSGDELKALKIQQAKEREIQRKKDQAARMAKERAERLKKRRFPMEDTRLHIEDKELGVKPPADVTKRPLLPYFFHSILPLDDAKRAGKTPSSILTRSKCDFLEYDSRGLVPDLLQVYHFFRGDVHFSLGLQQDNDVALVPEFDLQTLVFSVEEVLNGNAKRSRMVPPLISHLFVTCLKLLTMNTYSTSSGNDNESPHERRLKQDFAKLATALSPASWGQVCALYMDAMERYYTSSASADANVLACGKIDVNYLLRASDVAEPMTPAIVKMTQDNDDDDVDVPLPDGYGAYLGNPHGTLALGQAKLQKQDAWNLKAEELMALLRALTDDILATSPEIAQDLARRDEEMYELLKAKRAADTQFRKIKLAYEGPKNPSRSKSSAADKKKEADTGEAKEADEPSSGKKGSKENKENKTEDEEKTEAAPKFKPTATKKQFDAAAKAQEKAHAAYEKGIRTLTARTVPVGYDRNHNAVYFFNHDPDKLYVEISKPPAWTDDGNLPPDMLMKKYAWHVIETKSLFDSYTSSLDLRGKRENNLYEELLGPAGGHYSLKRGLYDDIKEKSEKAARLRQREELDRRLANARVACQAEEEEQGGRRSGRLQSKAQLDLSEIEKEIEDLEKRIEADALTPEAPDYEKLTGLEMLSKFDKASVRRETRRSRERKRLEAPATKSLPDMPCTQLIPTGDIDGTGLVGLVVSRLLELEETCEALSPWERKDTSRESWIADLEERVHTWNSSSDLVVGPPESRIVDDASQVGSESFGTPASKSKRTTPGSMGSLDSKRRKLDSGSPASTSSNSQASPAQILALLKTPLLDLEQRVFEITGLAIATQDADEADDNMSASSEDHRSSQEQKEKLLWKKKINALRTMDTRKHVQIREIVVEAITAARKAHFGSIVTKLRSALLLCQPHAAGECKNAALRVLDSHGGYHEEDVDSDEESETEEEAAEEEEEVPSALSAEAMALTGNLGGDDDADRIDWINAVKSCKTLSRWAALSSSFLTNAEKLLAKTVAESDSLWDSLKMWEKEEDRKAKGRTGKAKKKNESGEATEVWANVRYTNEFCMAKVDELTPYWPAKKCEAKDEELAKSLHKVGRTLVSLTGENGGLRAVRLEDIRPFDGELIVEEDLEEPSKAIRTQLDECMVVARRIVRGRKEGGANGGYQEEKKVAM